MQKTKGGHGSCLRQAQSPHRICGYKGWVASVVLLYLSRHRSRQAQARKRNSVDQARPNGSTYALHRPSFSKRDRNHVISFTLLPVNSFLMRFSFLAAEVH